jgi:hypothetical protein
LKALEFSGSEIRVMEDVRDDYSNSYLLTVGQDRKLSAREKFAESLRTLSHDHGTLYFYREDKKELCRAKMADPKEIQVTTVKLQDGLRVYGLCACGDIAVLRAGDVNGNTFFIRVDLRSGECQTRKWTQRMSSLDMLTVAGELLVVIAE